MALGSDLAADGENVGNSAILARGRDPKSRSKTVGDIALTDATILVLACWALLIVLAYTLRHHNH